MAGTCDYGAAWSAMGLRELQDDPQRMDPRLQQLRELRYPELDLASPERNRSAGWGRNAASARRVARRHLDCYGRGRKRGARSGSVTGRGNRSRGKKRTERRGEHIRIRA